MARPLRIDFPGARHHVMSRGPRRQLLFCDEDDFAAYLDLLGPVVERYAIRVFGYALMPGRGDTRSQPRPLGARTETRGGHLLLGSGARRTAQIAIRSA